MALLDLLGRRWALRVLWELRGEGGVPTFRELQAACGGISSSVLSERLRELREAGIVADAGAIGISPHRRGPRADARARPAGRLGRALGRARPRPQAERVTQLHAHTTEKLCYRCDGQRA